jgi:hypothetical protein
MATLRITRSNGCWVDVFDAERFAGNARRLHGPADYPWLRVRERDWGETIASLVVGPAAYVQCFDHRDFAGTVFWLLPNQSAERLADVEGADTADSLRLYDRPPFAHEPGYAAYMLWAASRVARTKE